MPQVKGFFSENVKYMEVGTFIGTEVEQSSESILRELVLGTENAELHHTRKLISWTIRSYVAEGAQELKSEVFICGLRLAAKGPKVDILEKMLDTFKQSKVSQAVNVDVPSRMETSTLKLQELGSLGFTLVTLT